MGAATGFILDASCVVTLYTRRHSILQSKAWFVGTRVAFILCRSVGNEAEFTARVQKWVVQGGICTEYVTRCVPEHVDWLCLVQLMRRVHRPVQRATRTVWKPHLKRSSQWRTNARRTRREMSQGLLQGFCTPTKRSMSVHFAKIEVFSNSAKPIV